VISKRTSFLLFTILIIIEAPLLAYVWWLFGTRDYDVPLLHGFLTIVALVLSSYLVFKIFKQSSAGFRIAAAAFGLPLALIWIVFFMDFMKGVKIRT
jgi:hypothetical protein